MRTVEAWGQINRGVTFGRSSDHHRSAPEFYRHAMSRELMWGPVWHLINIINNIIIMPWALDCQSYTLGPLFWSKVRWVILFDGLFRVKFRWLFIVWIWGLIQINDRKPLPTAVFSAQWCGPLVPPTGSPYLNHEWFNLRLESWTRAMAGLTYLESWNWGYIHIWALIRRLVTVTSCP